MNLLHLVEALHDDGEILARDLSFRSCSLSCLLDDRFPTTAFFFQFTRIDRIQIGLVAAARRSHFDERFDESIGLREFSAQQLAGERWILRGE